MSFQLVFDGEKLIDTDLAVDPQGKEDQKLQGEIKCHTPSHPVDPKPMGCGNTLLVVGQKNPFYFEKAPP